MVNKYIIVGGVAGGATTAARLRRLDENAQIVMFEKGNYISYANCGLPYYVGEVIPERDRLFVQTPESFKAKLNVDVRINSEVVSIDREKKVVKVNDLSTGESYEESYDKLVLSPGAKPVKPPIPGINDSRVLTMRSVPDTDQIKALVDEGNVRNAVVIGAGFIGLEMAENLRERGILVTIVEMADQVMNALDYEMAAAVHQHLKTKDVEFYLGDGVASFAPENNRLTVRLSSGKEIASDLVILSIGVRPDVKLAKDCDLEVGPSGGIAVNNYMQTSDNDIYALGDAVEMQNPIIEKSMCTFLAGPANKQGRIVADNIVNSNCRKYEGSIGTAIAKVFDLTVASTGLSEKLLEKENIPYLANITHGSSHAGYYPDALPLSLKVMFAPTDGKLLGAQIIGYDGIDKRIDLMATIIRQKGTIYDLQEIEHAYAPPYSSAKDPVNIAGFAAENILKGLVKTICWCDIADLDQSEIFLLDVRTPEEFNIDTIEGAINIPDYEIRERISQIPTDRKIIVFCGVGLRGYFSSRVLMQSGYDEVYNLSGGLKTYQHTTQKQSNEDIYSKEFIHNNDHIYESPQKSEGTGKVVEIDACGLQCPGPIQRLKIEIDKLDMGDQLLQTATDPGFKKDVSSWCNLTGNKLISVEETAGKIKALIQKGGHMHTSKVLGTGNNKTIVVFSDDMDKALASFVIANGAVASGKKVTMFFTFWGLNIIKKQNKPKVSKDIFGKMFGMMLPGSSKALTLSKMNMGGIGTKMMRFIMKSKKIDSLEKMIQDSIDSGVEMIGCQMSMDVMGVKEEEFLDNVKIGGVASYLDAAEQSNLNLFI